MVIIPVTLDQQPPDRIGADTIHPSGKRRYITDQVKALWNDFVITENSIYGHHFRMHITQPDQTVTLNTIPKIFLHIQMNRIRTGLPDFIQPFVATPERTFVRYITEGRNSTDFFQGNFRRIAHQVYTGKTETGITDFQHTQPGQCDNKITYCMVITGPVLPINFTHGFTDGFSETDTHLYRAFIGKSTGHNLNASLKFFPEIKQKGRMLF